MPDSEAGTGGLRFSGKRIAWILVCAICAASLVLSAFSVDSYMDIAKAKILSSVETSHEIAMEFDRTGNLISVNLTLGFRIVNPSDRELKIWILTYKGWVRDTPMEDGTDTTRWMIDGQVNYNGTDMRFYPVFVTSYALDNPSVIIQAESETTLTRWIEVDSENYPDILANIAGIYSHASANGREPEWLHYSSSILFIQGIPQFSGPNSDANLIRRFEGNDITPGVGGAS